MKLFTMILLIAGMMSCQKTNVTFKHHWVAAAYHDNQPLNHAFACDPSDYLGIDTIELDNTIQVDSTKFYPEVGTIVFDLRGKVDGDRYYHLLKHQID